VQWKTTQERVGLIARDLITRAASQDGTHDRQHAVAGRLLPQSLGFPAVTFRGAQLQECAKFQQGVVIDFRQRRIGGDVFGQDREAALRPIPGFLVGVLELTLL
jgi:hypothetical protein